MAGPAASPTGVSPSFLPALGRLVPPPSVDRLRSWLDTETRPGDVVLDPWARGGPLARMALDSGRRAISLELSPLTRLLAEVVLRPPDLLHLEAAMQAIAGTPWFGRTLRAALDEAFASRCPACGAAVVVDEVVWIPEGAVGQETPSGGGDAAPAPSPDPTPLPGYRPVEKRYRCWGCARGGRGPELRRAPLDDDDRIRATRPVDPAVLQVLADRFSPLAAVTGLAGLPVALHPPRELAGLAALVAAVEGERRAPGVEAALRLALAEAVAGRSPTGVLGAPVGAAGAPAGAVGAPAGAPGGERREGHPWLSFVTGYQRVRALVVGLHREQGPAVAARPVTTLAALLVDPGGPGVGRPDGGRSDRHPRVVAGGTVLVAPASAAVETELAREAVRVGGGPVRLLAGELPPPPRRGRTLTGAYVAAWVVGREAAAAVLADGAIGGRSRAGAWWQVVRASGSLARLRPLLAPEGRAVVVTRRGTRGLLAAVLAGRRAGYRLEAVVPGRGRGAGAVVLSGSPGEATDPRPPRRGWDLAAEAARTILARRGEPTPWGPLVAGVVTELGRQGILDRLMVEVEAQAGTRGDPVDRLVRRLAGTLRHPSARLVELEPGWWWLVDEPSDRRRPVPLSDRVEWAVFSLLTTGGPLRRAVLEHHLARLFADDPPDPEVVAAAIASYAAADPETGLLTPRDALAERSRQHARLVGLAASVGRRLGLAVSIAPRLRSQRVDGRPLADWLTSEERRRPAGAIAAGAPDALEEVDVIWYRRGRAVFFVEVEWTAMLADPLLQRHRRIPGDERTVRFLVVLPERIDLLAVKLERGPLLRRALREGNWHILRADRLEGLAGRSALTLADLEPHLGLHPTDEGGVQIPLFTPDPGTGAADGSGGGRGRMLGGTAGGPRP